MYSHGNITKYRLKEGPHDCNMYCILGYKENRALDILEGCGDELWEDKGGNIWGINVAIICRLKSTQVIKIT